MFSLNNPRNRRGREDRNTSNEEVGLGSFLTQSQGKAPSLGRSELSGATLPSHEKLVTTTSIYEKKTATGVVYDHKSGKCIVTIQASGPLWHYDFKFDPKEQARAPFIQYTFDLQLISQLNRAKKLLGPVRDGRKRFNKRLELELKHKPNEPKPYNLGLVTGIARGKMLSWTLERIIPLCFDVALIGIPTVIRYVSNWDSRAARAVTPMIRLHNNLEIAKELGCYPENGCWDTAKNYIESILLQKLSPLVKTPLAALRADMRIAVEEIKTPQRIHPYTTSVFTMFKLKSGLEKLEKKIENRIDQRTSEGIDPLSYFSLETLTKITDSPLTLLKEIATAISDGDLATANGKMFIYKYIMIAIPRDLKLAFRYYSNAILEDVPAGKASRVKNQMNSIFKEINAEQLIKFVYGDRVKKNWGKYSWNEPQQKKVY